MKTLSVILIILLILGIAFAFLLIAMILSIGLTKTEYEKQRDLEDQAEWIRKTFGDKPIQEKKGLSKYF